MKMTPRDIQLIEGFLFASQTPLTAQAIVKLYPEEEKPPVSDVQNILTRVTSDLFVSGYSFSGGCLGISFSGE